VVLTMNLLPLRKKIEVKPWLVNHAALKQYGLHSLAKQVGVRFRLCNSQLLGQAMRND
jgi:hypothetical protein